MKFGRRPIFWPMKERKNVPPRTHAPLNEWSFAPACVMLSSYSHHTFFFSFASLRRLFPYLIFLSPNPHSPLLYILFPSKIHPHTQTYKNKYKIHAFDQNKTVSAILFSSFNSIVCLLHATRRLQFWRPSRRLPPYLGFRRSYLYIYYDVCVYVKYMFVNMCKNICSIPLSVC
jgi:hypothetical protein